MQRFVAEKLRIARKVVGELRRDLGRNVIAVGISGSVARGTAEKYSDIDMEIIVRRPLRISYRFLIVEKTYCSLNFATWQGVMREVGMPHHELPETLGGFTKIRSLYDPKGLLHRLEARARHVPRAVFRKSAELALLHSYEDFCRVKNAYLKGDDIVLRDNVFLVTHSAALVVASLNRASFVSDREIFRAHKRFSRLPRGFDRIEQLRYGSLKPRRLYDTLVGFYIDLVDFCRKEGISFPVDRETLRELSGK